MHIQQIFDLPHREFTMTEDADISCNLPEFCTLFDDYLHHPSGDRLHAIGDNLYRISRYEIKECHLFDDLQKALKAF